jgi:hypothetical protein
MSADTQGMMCLWDISEASEINSLKVNVHALGDERVGLTANASDTFVIVMVCS